MLMGDTRGPFQDLDQKIAANVREYRESRSLSQDELAQQMTDRGFGFSQATIWKIESGQRPVKASELAALADALDILNVSFLLEEPEFASHDARLALLTHRAREAYDALKAATTAYLEVQMSLAFRLREARDAGAGVRLAWSQSGWLDTPPERAVIEARVEADQEEDARLRIDDEVDKILQAFRDHGYQPQLHPEDIEIVEPGDPPDAE
jgi:transcriptional regulator with XRE-family HTH domain